MGRYFKYLLLSAFLASVLLIVLLQFNSNRNINKLIDSNEVLINDLNTKSDLQHLLTDVLTLETRVRGTVIGGSINREQDFNAAVASVYGSLRRLDSLRDEKSILPLLLELNRVVDAKVSYSNIVMDSFMSKGKSTAEALINTQSDRRLTDTIKMVIEKIDNQHQLSVIQIIQAADNNGRKAKTLGTIMAIIAGIASIFIFTYVAYKVREQQELISRLNISERKAREAARIKENFLANMSHEIRTPLNAILGFTHLLQRKPLETEAKEYAQTIEKSGENLLTIINDVLDLSKIEAGMIRIESAPFSLRGLVHSIQTLFKVKASDKNLDLNFSISDDLPDTLEGDATRLTQILINLIGNAIKFTATGSVTADFSSNGISGSSLNLSIVITDTGIGIAEDQLNRVFERFQQAEDSVTRKYGGTGLGLSIVRELVTLQHGDIRVESAPGRGTSFKINIPYKLSSDSLVKPVHQPGVGSQNNFKNRRLLVVEDNEINQSLLKHFFDSWQLSFDPAKNGKEAVELLGKNSYDLILMDIQMPEMDGYTATEQIRKTLGLKTPIVAMTAHAMPGDREKCLSAGMDEYIAKPIHEEQLRQVINRFVPVTNTIVNDHTKNEMDHQDHFQYINLTYMKDVSGGNREYERAVTEQFLDAIPGDLQDIELAWKTQNTSLLKQLAHNLKTTVSVMGLNSIIEPQLSLLEHNALSEDQFEEIFAELSTVLKFSMQEAKQFYSSLI